eukprot:COSAG01_NODE_94_length_26962_cov_9.110933_3_plen_60_part_00
MPRAGRAGQGVRSREDQMMTCSLLMDTMQAMLSDVVLLHGTFYSMVHSSIPRGCPTTCC